MSAGDGGTVIAATLARDRAPFTITVFCGARCENDGPFAHAADQIGDAIAKRGWRVVYGGGHLGLMGALRSAVLGAGGSLTAVIPGHLISSEEVDFLPRTEIIETHTMRERKERMDTLCDAFLALPGGMGTMEELAEVMTLRQLGVHDRAVLVLDPDDYWGPLRAQMQRMVAASLADESVLDLAEFHPDVGHVLARLDELAQQRTPRSAARSRRDGGGPCRSTS